MFNNFKKTTSMNTELTQEQALGVLIQGVRLAQKAGAFSLEDAELLAKAIKVFVPKQEAQAEGEVESPAVEAETEAETEAKA